MVRTSKQQAVLPAKWLAVAKPEGKLRGRDKGQDDEQQNGRCCATCFQIRHPSSRTNPQCCHCHNVPRLLLVLSFTGDLKFPILCGQSLGDGIICRPPFGMQFTDSSAESGMAFCGVTVICITVFVFPYMMRVCEQWPRGAKNKLARGGLECFAMAMKHSRYTVVIGNLDWLSPLKVTVYN